MKANLIQQFKLPSYIKGKSFSDASKAIERKFKDRQDKASLDTKKELLSRLSKAQEYIKQLENPQPQVVPDTGEAFAAGGFMDTGLNEMTAGEGAGAVAGGVGSLLDMGMNAFGPTGIDTSGRTAAPKVQSRGMEALGGAAKGAAAGAALGPIGAAVGGVLGGVSGLLGGGKAKRDANTARFNYSMGQNANIREGDFAYGGKMKTNNYEHGGRHKVKPIPTTTTDGPGLGVLDMPGAGISLDTPLVNRVLEQDKVSSTFGQRLRGKAMDLFNNENIGDSLGSALRYAPIVGNALQLRNLDKPTGETRDRLDKRYKPQFVDEMSLRNAIEGSFNPNAPREGSGGSLAAYNTLSRAQELGKTKAVSEAYMQAENINRSEERTRQQFDLGVDRFNIGQSNLEQEIRARDLGAYETSKSRLQGQIGTDIGSVGKEETFKRMVKDSGLCYDSRGAYICGDTENRLTPEQAKSAKETNESKYGGYQSSDTMFSTYLEQVLNKNKK